MKHIEVSDEIYEALKAFGQSPNEVLTHLLQGQSEAAKTGDPLSGFTRSPAFRALHTDADRYLGILGFIYKYHGPDFRDFVEHLSSRRKYFGASPEEILETSKHNQARQIPHSPYWAIMNIDTATKRRFLRRALEYVGYPDATIQHTITLVGRSR